MLEFIKDHIDKFLLTALFLIMVGCVIVLALTHQNSDVVTWAKELASGFQGALLGLITGVAIGMKVAGSGNTINQTPLSDDKKDVK